MSIQDQLRFHVSEVDELRYTYQNEEIESVNKLLKPAFAIEQYFWQAVSSYWKYADELIKPWGNSFYLGLTISRNPQINWDHIAALKVKMPLLALLRAAHLKGNQERTDFYVHPLIAKDEIVAAVNINEPRFLRKSIGGVRLYKFGVLEEEISAHLAEIRLSINQYIAQIPLFGSDLVTEINTILEVKRLLEYTTNLTKQGEAFSFEEQLLFQDHPDVFVQEFLKDCLFEKGDNAETLLEKIQTNISAYELLA